MERRILTKHQQALQKAERVNILQYPGVCQLFVLACIVTDAFTLYTIFDIMLKQRPSLTLVITVMVATVLNMTPMIAAVCINNQEYTKQKKIAVCTILGILFITFFVQLLHYEWHHRSHFMMLLPKKFPSAMKTLKKVMKKNLNQHRHRQYWQF